MRKYFKVLLLLIWNVFHGVITEIIKHGQILVFKGAAAKKSQLREVGHFLERQGLKNIFSTASVGDSCLKSSREVFRKLLKP